MPWGRVGDDARTYPKLTVIRGYPGATRASLNEVFGFFLGCALASAAHVTDYVVDLGTVEGIAGDEADMKRLVKWCVRSGLMKPLKIDGVQHWVLHNDPDFVHIRTREELDAEKQNQADRRNLRVIVPVVLRDGDNCRYCGFQVHWTGRPSNRSGEFDHREHDGDPATPETMVVACRTCNGGRKNDPQWDATHTLLPPPGAPGSRHARPRFGLWSSKLLTDNGHPTEPDLAPEPAKRRAKDTATATAAHKAPRAQRPNAHTAGQPGGDVATPDDTAHAATVEDTAPGQKGPPKPDENGLSDSFRTGCAGSGRDGSESGSASPNGRRKRGRRGKSTTHPPNGCQQPYLQPNEEHPDDSAVICLTCAWESP